MIKNNYLALLLMKQYLVIALVFYTLAYVSAWGIGRPPVEVSVTTTQPTVDSLDTITIKISIKNLSDKIVKIDRRGWDPNLPHYGKILAIKSTEKAETHGLSIRAPGNIHHYYDRVPIGFGDLLPPDAHIAISENSTEELIHILEPHSEDLRYISLIDPGNYEIIYAPALYSGELSQLKVGSRSVQTSTTIQIKSPSKQKMDTIKDARDLRSLLLLARFHPSSFMAKNVEAFSQEERFNYIKAVSILPDFERDAFDVYEKLINQPLTIFEAAHILSDIRFRCGERYVSIAGKINSKHPELHGLIAFVIYDLDPKSSVEYLETTLAKEIDSIKEGGTPRSDYLRSLERRLFEARLSRIGD